MPSQTAYGLNNLNLAALKSGYSGKIQGYLSVCSRIVRLGCVLWISVGSVGLTQACEVVPERIITNGLLSGDYQSAKLAVNSLSTTDSLIPSASFYSALIDWYQEQSSFHRTGKVLDKSRLLDQVTLLKEQYDENNSEKTLLAWSLAGALTAKALFINQQKLTGYRIGIEAVENLQLYLEADESNEQEKLATTLVLGLYQLFIRFTPNDFAWLKPNLKELHTQEQAEQMIASAAQHSSIFAPEAARILLMEIPWRLPHHCQYLNIAEQLSKDFPNNADISLARLGLLIRCGNFKTALTEYERAKELIQNSPFIGYGDNDYLTLLELSSYRIYANLADISRLQQGSEQTMPYRQFAQANALDLMGERQQAIKLYKALAESNNANSGIRKSATIRMSIPYRKPETISENSSLNFFSC